jgi:hypothetical protein
MSDKTVFYVYILFDWLGVPRYVGKGRGNRWINHERRSSANWMKDEFVERTWMILGDIPKVKVSEQLSEHDAFAIELALIKAIGRFPNGPLVNMTDGGEGPSGRRCSTATRRLLSELRHAHHANLTAAQRSAVAYKGAATMTPEQRSARARKRNAGLTREQLSGIAAIAGRASIAKRTSEQQSKSARSHTREHFSAMGRKGGRALPSKEKSAAVKKGWAKFTPEQRSERLKKAAIGMAPEQLTDRAKKGWTTRRARALLSQAEATRDPD